MFKFLHAADIHLDSAMYKLDQYEGAPVDELRGATRRAFENLIELAITEKVAFVLLAGDLYDGDWKDYNTGLYFVSQVGRLQEADIPVFMIAGNHDAASKITKALRLPEGVQLLQSDQPQTVLLEGLDVAIHGQSFASPAVKKDLAVNYPPRLKDHLNIGLLHTCLSGREGHEPYAPCTVDGLKTKGYDYWALGHVHQQELLSNDPPIVFPGNTQGRHTRETGAKGCMLVEVDNKGRAHAQFRSLDVARWFRLDIDASTSETGYEVVDSVVDQLGSLQEENQGLPLVVRIRIFGDSKAHEDLASDIERWGSEIRSAAVDVGRGSIWVEKLKVQTRLPLGLASIGSSAGPVGELLAYIDEIGANPDLVDTLVGALADLEKRLPNELRAGSETLAINSREWVGEILQQVKPLLVHRLTRTEDVK